LLPLFSPAFIRGRNVFIESLILMSILGSPFSFLFPFIVLPLIDSIFCYFLNRREKLEMLIAKLNIMRGSSCRLLFVLFCFNVLENSAALRLSKHQFKTQKGGCSWDVFDSIKMDSLPKRVFFLSCPF